MPWRVAFLAGWRMGGGQLGAGQLRAVEWCLGPQHGPVQSRGETSCTLASLQAASPPVRECLGL